MNENKHIIDAPSTNEEALNDLLDNMYITNVERRLRDLNNPTVNDKKRWIWELIQNAKDTIANNPTRNGINVRIELEGDIVRFKHDGAPFTAKSRLGLLYKYSDGKESQESTGRFGTGFLTTHCLSKIVTIESNMYKDKEQTELCGFQVTMYRDGLVKNDLLDGLRKMKSTDTFFDELFDWTTFTYHVNSDTGREAIKLGVENFHENITQTMLFCQELHSIVLDDNGRSTTIIRKPIQTLSDNVFLATFEITGEKHCTRRFIYTHFEESNDKLTARYKAERSIRLDIAVEVDDSNCLVEHIGKPSHFCVLPLVGIEKQLAEPIIINCPDFEPDSERQSLMLSGVDYNEENNVITETGINRLIYSKVFPLFEKIVSFLSSNNYGKLYYLAYGLGKIIVKKDNLDDKWYEDNVIKAYRDVLLKYPIAKAYRNESMLNLSDCIIVAEKKEFETALYSLLTSLFPSNIVTDNHEWAQFIWKDQLRVWTSEDLCKVIESKENLTNIQLADRTVIDWYNAFLDFIAKYDERLLKEYALLPNMNGLLLKKDEKVFKQGEHITTFIIELVENLGKDLKPLLLHNEITTVNLDAKYNSQSYSAEVNRLSKSIIDDKSISTDDKVLKLLPLLSIIPNDSTRYEEDFIKKRKRIYEIITSIHQQNEVNSSIDNSLLDSSWKETDIWFETHVLEFLHKVGHLNNLPDGLNSCWLNDCLVSLNVQTSRLNEYAVLPNQNGDFCFQEKLFKDENISDALKDDIFDSIDINYKDILVHKDIDATRFSIVQSKNTRIFANELKPKFANLQNSSSGNFFRYYYHHFPQDKLDKIARYLISILPSDTTLDLYKYQKSLFDISNKILGEEINYTEQEICFDSIELWHDANVYVANQIAEKISEIGTIEKLCLSLGNCGTKNAFELLNHFYDFLLHYNIKYASMSIFPNQNGEFKVYSALKKEEGHIDDILKNIICCLVSKEDDYRTVLIDNQSILKPQVSLNIEDAFSFIDGRIFELYEIPTKRKDATFIQAVHLLLEEYNQVTQKHFPKTYPIKDTILIDVVWPQEKREKLMKISNKLTDEKIETILENDAEIEELTNRVNQLENTISQLSVIQEIENKYPGFDFSTLLEILEKEQGQFSLSDVEHNVSDERKLEIGDEGECFIYEKLCAKFGEDNVHWSNKGDADNYQYKRTFQGKDYYFVRTSHDFDFKLNHNGFLFYIEVKTTVGSVKNCRDFPLFFQTKEWEWIDNNTEQASHYIIRVFDIETNPKAYFLKQTLEID